MGRELDKGHVFISYSKKHRDLTIALADYLSSCGLLVWWDRELAARGRFDDQLFAELEHAGAVVVLWTRGALTSDWVRREAMFALKRDMLINVLASDVDQNELPEPFRHHHRHRPDDATRAWSPCAGRRYGTRSHAAAMGVGVDVAVPPQWPRNVARDLLDDACRVADGLCGSLIADATELGFEVIIGHDWHHETVPNIIEVELKQRISRGRLFHTANSERYTRWCVRQAWCAYKILSIFNRIRSVTRVFYLDVKNPLPKIHALTQNTENIGSRTRSRKHILEHDNPL